jgi:hypothetical protein
MLYPLSYEGLRPISYLAGDIHECPGVPWDAHRCHAVHRWDSVAGRGTCGANFAYTRPGVPGGDRGCSRTSCPALGFRGGPSRSKEG